MRQGNVRLLAALALVTLVVTACAPDPDPAPDPEPSASSVVSSPTSAVTPSSSPSPTPTTTPAGATDLVAIDDVNRVEPYPAGEMCEFPISINNAFKKIMWEDDKRIVEMYADENVVITNTENEKVFDVTGDGLGIINLKDQTQGDSIFTGKILHFGEYTLPGQDERKKSIILVKDGEAEAIWHDMFSENRWMEFTKITGDVIDVCVELK